MDEQLSFSGKKWTNRKDVSKQEALFDFLLENLNVPKSELPSFFSPHFSHLHDPWIMSGMKNAISRILHALKNKERIMIFGDFDTDGITSTVILVSALREMGADVSYRIPHRKLDSHGLKKNILDEIFSKKVSLVMTCDCGINDTEELAYARTLGMDTIVTDHHEPDPTIHTREAIAVLNPRLKECLYPEKNLSGAGIAFQVVNALWDAFLISLDGDQKILFLKKYHSKEHFLKKYLELAAIGLIADCVPLRGENRIFAKLGLEQLKSTQWPGLRLMMQQAQIDVRTIDAETVSFVLAPRLNASSRIGDVMKATELFLGTEKNHQLRLAQLEIFNEKRKHLTSLSFQKSLDQIHENASCQILRDDTWDLGVLGLLASRHTEHLRVPVIAAALRKDGFLAASARAPLGYSLIRAFQEHASLFHTFGGHDLAAGFVAKPSLFLEIQTALSVYFQSFSAVRQHEIFVSAFLNPALFHFDLVDFLRLLGPFGAGNDRPIFGIRRVKIVDYTSVGTHRNHIKFTFSRDKKFFNSIAFFAENFLSYIQIDDTVDIAFTLSDSYWNGQRRLEIRIVDMRRS